MGAKIKAICIEWCKEEYRIPISSNVFSLPFEFIVDKVVLVASHLHSFDYYLKGIYVTDLQRESKTLLHFLTINLLPEIQ